MGSNNVNNAPREYGSIQSIQQREGSSNWYSKEVQPRRLDQLWKTPVDLID
jgi:antibiotic biosynthesis monooxygenase (ABM) superfamily enzyme